MKRGFTLVELIAVVAVIVVLLALLAPALDQAIYQAELAVCSARFRALGSGVVGYAMNARRWYPYRSGVHADGELWQPMRLAGGRYGSHDDRLALRDEISLNGLMNDPFLPQVNIDGSDPDANVFATAELWFGFRYGGGIHSPGMNPQLPGGGQQRGMLKLGDRLQWGDDQFNLLASDRDLVQASERNASGAHPDKAGVMSIYSADNEVPRAEMVAIGTGFFGGPTWTIAAWESKGVDRGPVDTNHVYADLSVARLVDVRMYEAEESDSRVVKLPPYSNANWGYPVEWTSAPRN